MTDPQLWVFAGYFLVIFAIGYWSLRTTSDESDYWIAGGRLGWVLGGSTMAATHTSAGTFIGTIGVVYTVGWSFGWLLLSIPLAYWVLASIVAPRFTSVRELTLPAFIERRYYSRKARGIAGAIVLSTIVVYVQAQIVAGGLVANIVFDVSVETGMVVFTIILLAYTVVGGMLAVVYTDLLQTLIMIVGAAVAVPLTLRHLDGAASMVTYADALQPAVFTWEGMPGTLLFTMGLAFFLGSIASPEKLIRLYAMKDMRTIRRGVLLTIAVATGVNILVMVLAVASVVLFPALPTGDMAMPMVARAVLPTVLGGLILAAVTSAMMSTVDSLLIVAGSALSEDIYPLFVDGEGSRRNRLLAGRLGTLVVGIVPLLLILSGVGEGELVQFIVLLFTALMASSFLVPVLLGIYWRRATREGAVSAMVGGLVAAVVWKAVGPPNLDPVVAGVLVSLILMVGVSLVTAPPPASALAPYFPGDSG